MTIDVHEARPSEYAEAGSVTAAAYREFVRPNDPSWEDYLARIADIGSRADRATILVATKDGRLLGSATLELDGRIDESDPPLLAEEAHLRMLGVDPSARRLGVARTLMEACLSRATESGKTLMTLNTTKRMQAAQRMYESLGFVRGEDRVFPDGFVLLTYSMRIAPREEPSPATR